MKSTLQSPPLQSHTSTTPNYNGTSSNLPAHSPYNSVSVQHIQAQSPYLTLQEPFTCGRRQDSTTDDEYDGEEFDDDSSTLVTPPMSSPLIKHREADERWGGRIKSKDDGGSGHWVVDGDEVKFAGPDVDGFKTAVNGKPDNYESLRCHAGLGANGYTGSLQPGDPVILSAASETVCSGLGTATLASPVLHRSDSVKFCRSSNGNAQRSGYGSPVPGMAGSTPAAGANRPARRVPSLKLKRLHVLGSRGGSGGGGGGAGGDKVIPGDNTVAIVGGANNAGNVDPTVAALRGHVNPSITITLDSDSDSVYSDYLSPEINYKTHECKVQFLGDETSLYGTPKEELPAIGDTMASDVFPKTSSTTSYLREQIMNFFQPSDNKLAMKLFGNKNALIKEKMRHKRVGNWVIHPCSNFR